MPGYSELRKNRISTTEAAYHLNFSTKNRVPYFTDNRKAHLACKAIHYCSERGWCENYAFVIMPDHIHWLVRPKSKSISELVRVLKEYLVKSTDELKWQRGFYDGAVWDEDRLIEIARYIIANPKRAGLVSHVGEYPYWGCCYL